MVSEISSGDAAQARKSAIGCRSGTAARHAMWTASHGTSSTADPPWYDRVECFDLDTKVRFAFS